MKKYSCFIFLIVVFLSGCVQKSVKNTPVEDTAFLLDTIVTITVYDATHMEDAPAIIEDCFALCASYEEKLSRTIAESEVNKINASHQMPTLVSSDTAGLIQEALAYSRLSHGNFDITIAPVSSLWDFHAETPKPPSAEQIQTALSFVNYEAVIVEDQKVTLSIENAALDLGGIAKGYIADQAADFLKQKGIASAILNFGGNVYAIGGKTDGTPFAIGIQKPFGSYSDIIGAVSISNQAVVTSGIYERFFYYDDQLYHHIINPKTGYPVKNNLFSVTIISSSSTKADALSTACFVMGLEDGMSLIEAEADAEAIFVTEDNQLYFSSGINQTIPFTPH